MVKKEVKSTASNKNATRKVPKSINIVRSTTTIIISPGVPIPLSLSAVMKMSPSSASVQLVYGQVDNSHQ
jgi:hypothetical protein